MRLTAGPPLPRLLPQQTAVRSAGLLPPVTPTRQATDSPFSMRHHSAQCRYAALCNILPTKTELGSPDLLHKRRMGTSDLHMAGQVQTPGLLQKTSGFYSLLFGPKKLAWRDQPRHCLRVQGMGSISKEAFGTWCFPQAPQAIPRNSVCMLTKHTRHTPESH